MFIVLNSLILLNYHVITGLTMTGKSFIASVGLLSYSSALLMCGSLQKNVINLAINMWRKRLKAR